MRRHIVLAMLLLAGALAPTAAWGISYGVPDDGAHPNVAALVVVPSDPDTGRPMPQILCTGTLVDSDTIVTASHCSEFAEYYFPGAPVRVTFADVVDSDRDGFVDPGVKLLSGTLVTHPGYGAPSVSNPYDVAVFELDKQIRTVTPAGVPTVGYLDDKGLQTRTYTVVGYGAVRETNRTASQAWTLGWRRMRADQTISSVTDSWVTFSMNQATGDGGTCAGDSGGPHFLGSVVVSVTVTGDAVCKATDKTYRLDTPWVRGFLSAYVDLP